MERQQKFTPGCYCIMNLDLFGEFLTDAPDKYLIMDTLFFDNVPHITLRAKIKPIGIVGSLLSWLESFLSSRSLKLRIEYHMSVSSPVLSGISQCPVLGQLLFLIYINHTYLSLHFVLP